MTRRVILEDTGHSKTANTREQISMGTQSVQPNLDSASSFKFDVNLFELAQLLVRKRKLIAGIVLAVVLITSGYMFWKPNLYTSQATILPSGKSMSGGLNSMKSLVGLADPLALSDENSSEIFPVVLRSDLVVSAVLNKKYSFSDSNTQQSLTLAQYFDEDNPDRLRKNLRDQTTIGSNKQTGQISIGVETSSPELSQLVLAEYLAQLEDFNVNKRQSSAKSNASFLSHQMEIVGKELHDAEDELEYFQLKNMNWGSASSPEIIKELGRLQLAVEINSSTYTNLCHQYESAKVDAQKDVPIVRILDTPSLPTIKSGPFRRQTIIMSGLLAFMLTLLIIIGIDIAQQGASGANRTDFESFRTTLRQSFPRTDNLVNRINRGRISRSTPAKSSSQEV